MNDHITDELTSDIAIAHALRTFLSSPAITSMIQACVTEAANAEVQRLISDDRILNVVTAAISASFPSSPAQSRLSDKLGSVIRADIAEETRYLLNEDTARDFIRDELESQPRYFTRAIENIVEASVDTDEIVDTVKDRVIEDIDLDDLGIEDKINEALGSRTADIGDHIVEYFDDDDNLAALTKRIIESVSISIGDRNFTPEKVD
jgi:hypothetical protein